jgi:hypothetical protein
MNTYTDTRFFCPRCSSNKFGSSVNRSTGRWTRYCHGDNGCTFTFDDTHDWMYFRVVATTTFDSPEEYKEHERKLREQPPVAAMQVTRG